MKKDEKKSLFAILPVADYMCATQYSRLTLEKLAGLEAVNEDLAFFFYSKGYEPFSSCLDASGLDSGRFKDSLALASLVEEGEWLDVFIKECEIAIDSSDFVVLVDILVPKSTPITKRLAEYALSQHKEVLIFSKAFSKEDESLVSRFLNVSQEATERFLAARKKYSVTTRGARSR